MKIQLSAVTFDGDVRGPGAKADGRDTHHYGPTFAVGQKQYSVGIVYDTDIAAVRLTHPTAKERRSVLVPWSRVVHSDEVEAAEPAKK